MESDIGFAFDSATLSAAGHNAVQDIANQIKSAEGVEAITVVGYTDRLGSDAYNQRLSQQRAQAVSNALVAAGLPANAITAHGAGSSNPVVQCDQGSQNELISCLAPNRRVEVQTR